MHVSVLDLDTWTLHFLDYIACVFCVFSGEVTNTNFIVFGLQLSGLEPTIYHTWGEHANHYATDAVSIVYVELINMFKLINFKSGCERRGR